MSCELELLIFFYSVDGMSTTRRGTRNMEVLPHVEEEVIHAAMKVFMVP
jgi:hypothetical protein